jgi:hypothetical protein
MGAPHVWSGLLKSTSVCAALVLLSALFELRCSNGAGVADDFTPLAGGPGERDTTTIRLRGSAEGGAGADLMNPLCGRGDCQLETNLGCRAPAEGGAGGEPGFAGSGGVAGAAGSPMGGEGPKSAPLTEPGEACRVRGSEEDCSEDCERIRSCEPQGQGQELGPCFSPSDCADGLTCVGEGGSGICRRYCCTAASCGANGFCELGQELGTELEVPVCARLTVCSTLDPYPCPEGKVCPCGSERVCAVVKSDGRTGCVVPGQGQEGDDCAGYHQGECAAGFVCSSTLGCLRICQLGEVAACGSQAICQAPADFAPGLGVCVGASESASDG